MQIRTRTLVRLTMARLRRSSRAPGPRRQTEWLSRQFVTDIAPLSVSTKLLVGSLDATEKGKLPFTIIRTLGMLMVCSDQQIATEDPFGALGATVVTDRAVTVGITALPDPITEHNADYWFLYHPWSASQFVGVSIAGGIQVTYFDSKAQRKVEEGEDVVFILTNGSQFDGAEFILTFRMLIKLH